jgi:hypothetical protein
MSTGAPDAGHPEMLRELANAVTGHVRPARNSERFYSRLAGAEPPEDLLPIVQLFSTESRIFYRQSKARGSPPEGVLIWDWRWIQFVESLVEHYQFAFYQGKERQADGAGWIRATRARIEQTTVRFVLEQLHPKNSIWRSAQSTELLEHYLSLCIQLSEKMRNDQNPLLKFFPPSERPFTRQIMANLIGLTLDHEIGHYCQGIRSQVYASFSDFFEKKFFSWLRSTPTWLTVNPNPISPWNYLHTLDRWTTSGALEMISDPDYRNEVLSDLMAAGASFLSFTKLSVDGKPFERCGYREQANVLASAYEGLMLWQATLMYLRGLQWELLRLESPDANDLDPHEVEFGTRKLLIDVFAWWSSHSFLSKPTDPQFTIASEILNQAEQQIQAFVSILSHVGYTYSSHVQSVFKPASRPTDVSAVGKYGDRILELTQFPN